MQSVTVFCGLHAGDALWQSFVRNVTRRGAVWIAPSPAAARAIRRRLARQGPVAVVSSGVTTLHHLAGEVLTTTSPETPCRLIDRVMRRRLIGDLVDRRRQAARLNEYGRIERRASLVSLIEQELDSAEARGANPDRLLRQAKSTGATRLVEFAEFFADYRATLATHGLVDAYGRLRLATSVLRDTQAGWLRWRMAAVGSVDAVSKTERDFLLAVMGRAESVAVALAAADESASEADTTAAPLGWLRASCDRVTVVAGKPTGGVAPDVAFVDRNLFRDTSEEPPALPHGALQQPSVAVLPGASVEDEIECVARRVKRRLREGVPPDEVLVASPSLEAVRDRVCEAFDEVGVPLAVAGGVRLGDAPIVQCLRSVLTLPLSGWRHADVLRVLTSRSLAAFDSAHASSDTGRHSEARRCGLADRRAAAELAVRRLLLPEGREALMDQLRRGLHFAETRASETADEPGRDAGGDAFAFRCAVEMAVELGAAVDALPTRAAPLAWFDAIRGLLDRLAYSSPDAVGRSSAEFDLAALESLESSFASLERLARWSGASAPRLTLAEAAENLADWSARVRVELSADDQGRVRLVSVDQACHERPRHLFAVGLVEGSLPRQVVDGAPFVSVSPALRQDHLRREMDRFRQLVAAASESVVLSYPSVDEKGQPLHPSSFVADLRRLFLPRSIELQASEGPEPACPADLRSKAVAELNSGNGAGLVALAADEATAASARQVLDGLTATLERSTGDELGPYEGVLQSDAAKQEFRQRFGPEHLWSPSQLELYAMSPFDFFLRHVLRIEPLGVLALDIDYRRRGSLLHDAMVRFHAACGEEGDPLGVEEGERRFAEQYAAAVSAAADSIGTAPHERALLRVEAMQAAAWAPMYRDQLEAYRHGSDRLDEPMRPTYFEARFGPRRSSDATDETLSTDEPF
ncbi:MAG: PD-(D/E)XK nuclease family protein, partial [Planctomycetota bacterium]